tara:strand:+ start:2216 stop:2587 length:372 start_codon:yes stop_codon:yes gene_type:complete
MPRGYTSITLKGGERDGQIIEDISLRHLPNMIGFRSECYFATSESGGMNIIKGELNSHWHSYSEDVYVKAENEKYKTGTIFEFIETINIERCSAITKKKTQCLKPAIDNQNYCSETHNLIRKL